MKRTAVAVLFALIASLLSGCANLGNGKLDGPVVDAAKNVDAGAIIKAAAAGASGDYAKALAEIGKAVEKREAKGDPLAGYAFTRTYFYDGTPVPDPSRITWVDKWERTASAGTATPPAVSTGTASGEPATAEDDALAGEIADILTDLGLARE